jgi:enterobacteria phage integrase
MRCRSGRVRWGTKKKPPHVECFRDQIGKLRVYFRRKGGPRIPLPTNIGSPEFEEAYRQALLAQPTKQQRPKIDQPAANSFGALIAAYLKSGEYASLRDTTKKGYKSRIEQLRILFGHRSVKGLTRERIVKTLMTPMANKPGAALSLLKMFRVLVQFAMTLDDNNPLHLTHDPSQGIERPKTNEIRSWTEDELATFEAYWPIGTKQRTAFALMLYVGSARVDTHKLTWRQIDSRTVEYTRNKTNVDVTLKVHGALKAALAATPRTHVVIITTEFGQPFTVNGFSRFMRDAIRKAGLPLGCQPHGLRKSLGRRLAEIGATTHEIMAVLGHRTLEEAERYTRDADRKRAGNSAIIKLEAKLEAGERESNRSSQNTQPSFPKQQKTNDSSTT